MNSAIAIFLKTRLANVNAFHCCRNFLDHKCETSPPYDVHLERCITFINVAKKYQVFGCVWFCGNRLLHTWVGGRFSKRQSEPQRHLFELLQNSSGMWIPEHAFLMTSNQPMYWPIRQHEHLSSWGLMHLSVLDRVSCKYIRPLRLNSITRHMFFQPRQITVGKIGNSYVMNTWCFDGICASPPCCREMDSYGYFSTFHRTIVRKIANCKMWIEFHHPQNTHTFGIFKISALQKILHPF